jgi:23S rRNA pseudouridine2605 synthase
MAIKKNTGKRGDTKPSTGRKSRTGKDKKPLTKKQKKYLDYKNQQAPKKTGDPLPSFSTDIRLNKFISNAGICSRREADVMIESGIVEVNGEVMTEMGYKVKPTDKVRYGGESIKSEKKRYVILNKPKNIISQLYDKKGRKTVLSFIKKACKEEVVPMVEIDTPDTGLMFFTNDTDLIKKLTHPNSAVNSLYHLTVDKPMSMDDVKKLAAGVDVDNKRFKAETVELVDGKGGREIGMEVRSNRQYQIKKMVQSLGYKIVKQDLVMYAGLTKKDLPRGYYRYLTENEISFLKMK